MVCTCVDLFSFCRIFSIYMTLENNVSAESSNNGYVVMCNLSVVAYSMCCTVSNLYQANTSVIECVEFEATAT